MQGSYKTIEPIGDAVCAQERYYNGRRLGRQGHSYKIHRRMVEGYKWV